MCPDEPVWPAAPGGGGGAGTAAQPLLVTAAPYNAKCDARFVGDAAITTGTNTLSSTQAAFTTADVGKVVIVNDAGGVNTPLVGWITSVTGGVATLMTTKGGATPANASATVSGAVSFYGTDDTAAYQALITDLYGNVGAYGRIPGLSMIAGALNHTKRDGLAAGGNYNAQLPLPALTINTHQQRRIKLVGDLESGTVLQGGLTDTTNRLCGLVTTLTGQTYDATFGWPCLIGGPAGNQTNVDLECENLAFYNPENPSIGLVYAQNLANASFTNCTFNSTVMAGSASFGQPSNPTGFGLWMPGINCNQTNRVKKIVAIGQYYGIIPGEHTDATSVYATYCRVGFGQQQMSHIGHISYGSIEACTYGFAAVVSTGAAAITTAAYIDFELDIEATGGNAWNTTTWVVWDNGGNVKGLLRYYCSLGNANFTGVSNLLLTRLDAVPGAWAAITAGTGISAAAGSGMVAAQATVDSVGNGLLAGVLTATAAIASGSTIGTLPAIAIPAHSIEMPVATNGTVAAGTVPFLFINTSGQIQLYNASLAIGQIVALSGTFARI